MRFVVLALFLFVTAAGARAAEIEFVRVWPSWREAESFDRISEYFTEKENTGGHTVLRTQPGARAGYYFLVRLKALATAPAGAKFVLNLITPTDPAAKAYTFSVSAAAGGVFELGLTGADWPDQKTHPLFNVVAAGRQPAQGIQCRVITVHHRMMVSFGPVTSRRFVSDDCGISAGMQIMLTETLPPKIFSVSPRKFLTLNSGGRCQ